MEGYLSLDSQLAFDWMSPEHVSALAVILIFNIFLYLVRNILPDKVRSYGRLALAALLMMSELSLQLWEIRSGIWALENSLPLQLCSISLVLTALMVYTRNENIYQVVYFWGLAGASQALLTPDLCYGFPHFAFLQFFVSHGLIITGCLWMTFMEGCRPDLNSIGKAFFMTNLYAVIIGLFNGLTGSNYLYLCRKPANPSILDYLGDWPWYILSMEVLALFLFFLCALPFLPPQGLKTGA